MTQIYLFPHLIRLLLLCAAGIVLLGACTQSPEEMGPSDPPENLPRPVPPRAAAVAPWPTAAASATPTTTLAATATAPVDSPELTSTATITSTTAPAATSTADAILLPTVTPTLTPTSLQTNAQTNDNTLLPTVTPTPAPTTSAATNDLVLLPTPTSTPASMRTAQTLYASGNYTSQTTYPDGQIAHQTGFFTIEQAPAANAYGVNQRYTLTSFNPALAAAPTAGSDNEETITVYQIHDYIAIDYPDRDWVVLHRDQGSSLVQAIQPITELARIIPRFIDRAQRIPATPDNGAPASTHYRVTDPDLIEDDFLRPLLATSGEIPGLTLDAWLDDSTRTVVRYIFQVEIHDARVLDADFESTTADQIVTWSYTRQQAGASAELTWPPDAPDPNRIEVPGFAPGQFPLPPGAELTAIYGGAPEFLSAQTVDDISAFYQARLAELGWSVEGSGRLLRAQNAGTTLQLLIVAEDKSEETRISVLPAE